jgi:hypothetical protein
MIVDKTLGGILNDCSKVDVTLNDSRRSKLSKIGKELEKHRKPPETFFNNNE